MRPLNLHRVQKTRRTAQQRAAGKRKLRQGMIPPLVQGSSSVCDALPSFQLIGHLWVVLESLELLVPENAGFGVRGAERTRQDGEGA